jgi:hypothetical protein
MTAQLRSELLKLRSTRTNLALLAWMAGLVVLVVALHVLSFGVGELSRDSNQMKILGLGTSIGALFAALLGAMSITGEFRTGTIRPTFLVTPRRTRVVAAKVMASMLAGVGVGLIAEALTAGAEAAGLAVRGVHVELSGSDYAQLLAGGARRRPVRGDRRRRRRDGAQSGRGRRRAVRLAAVPRAAAA